MNAPRTPKYRRHCSGGRDRAFVELDGQRTYLGRYGSPESIQRYDQLVAEWLVSGRRRAAEPADLTVVELCARFLKHAKRHYRRADGTPTSTIFNYKSVIPHLTAIYGRVPVTEFGPLSLKAVRQRLIDAGWRRSVINQAMCFIRGIFRWAASAEIVPIAVHEALRAVEPLRWGRTAARESEPIRPVPAAHIRAVRPHISRQVWAMIQLQRLTGMRPGEVVQMRAIDLDTSGRVWAYTPASHKTEHRGHGRTVYLGPRAQVILEPFLKRELTVPLFSPRNAICERAQGTWTHRRANQAETPRMTTRTLRDRYDTASYRRSITRACVAAQMSEWSPNQLRHNAATRLRREFGIDLAATILGHRLGSQVTEIYVEANVARAVEVMARVG